ncbi:MAG: hypothetical protein ACFFER_06310 [Candidatus Thorarchaeota archaeon]
MQENGFERASRWADRIQLFALIAVLLIVSAAVWLASYFLIQPFVQDNLVQMLIATSVSLALAGSILVWRRRVISGTILLFMSAGVVALSLALLWQSMQASILSLHGFLLASIVILNSLRNREGISNEAFRRIGWVLGPAILMTGPIAIALGLWGLTSSFYVILAGFIGALSIYAIALQYLQKYSRLGIPNVIIVSLAPSMLTVDFLISSATLSPILLASGFLVTLGATLFVTSQCARRVQSWAGARLVRKSQKKRRTTLLEEIGLAAAAEEDEEGPPIPEEWIIAPEDANALSGISLILVASGIPSIFLWLAESTMWGTEIQLIGPIALIIGLLILAPSPVLFRLGERLTVDSEYMAVRTIGVAIVSLASVSGYLWTQYYLWPVLISFTTSVVLLVAGMTGLFRWVRRIWKRIWLSIVSHLRDLKAWILSNMLLTGIVADFTFCIFLFEYINPMLQPLLGYPISILSVLATVFAGVGIVGLTIFRSLPNRHRFLSMALIMFLGSLALATFWQFYYIMSIDVIGSLSYSLLWFLGSIALLKLGVNRIYTGTAYLPGLLAAVSLALMFDDPLQSNRFPILTLLLLAVLPGPILHIEYRKAGRWISAAAIRAGRAIVHGVRRLGAAIHHALISIGRFLLKFILISWAVFVLVGLAFVAWQWLAPFYSYDSLPIIGWIALTFFLAYAPAIGRAEDPPSYLFQICILGAALGLGVLVFFYTEMLHTAIRFLASVSAICLAVTLTKSKFPEAIRIYFIPTTWLMMLALVCTWIYLEAILSYGELQSALSALALFGFGLLPLRLMGAAPRIINGFYLALTVPTATLLVHLFYANYILSLIVLVLMPIPVAYRKYWNAVLSIGTAALMALRVFLAYIAIHLVAAIACFSVLIASLFVYYLIPFFSFHLVPLAPISLTFILTCMCIWFPALHLRKSEYLRLHSVALIILSAAVSLDLVILLQLTDPILNILGSVTLFSVLFTISMPVMIFFKQQARSAAFAIGVAVLLGLYLAQIDPISKVFLAVFGVGLIATPVISKANRVLFAYPVVTGALLAFLFWHFYLYTLDAMLVVAGYVAVESMLVSIPEQLRTKATWTVFAGSTGMSIALVLSPFMTINLVLAALVALEILRFTPDLSIGEKTGMLLGIARAALVGASAYLLIISWIPATSQLRNPLMELGLSSLAATLILAVSMRDFISSEKLIGLQSVAVFNLCFVMFSYLWATMQVDSLYSAYIAGIPLLAFTAVLSKGETFKRASWMVSCLVATAMVSFSWFTYYRSIESLWLCVTTAVFLFSSLRLTDPKGHEDSATVTNIAVATLIAMLQVIWIWHSLLVFLFDMNVILAGVGLLLTPVILMPLRGATSWDVFRVLWSVVSAIIAVSLGSFIVGWSFYELTLPSEPYLSTGTILSLFSILCTPAYLLIEGKLKVDEDHLTARYSWSPSLVGWAALGAQMGASLLGEMRFMITVAGLGFALALLILYLITPARPRALFMGNIIILASAVAGGVWIWAEPILGPAELIALFLFVWYILSLPLTLAVTITFLGWLATKGKQLAAAFSRFLSWAKGIFWSNKAKFATILPVMIGGLVSLWIYDPLDTSAILGLPYRNLAFSITISMALVGLLYWLEAAALEPPIGDELQSPSAILTGFGVNNILLLMSLTAESYDPLELIFSLSLAASLALIATLAQVSSFSQKVWMRRNAGILGISLFMATLIGFTSIVGMLPIHALVYATIILLVVEAPVFWTQVKAFVAILGRYGAILVKAIRNLGSLLLRIFRSFGYVAWTFFSLLFVAVIGALSRPLFSELLNMPPTGVFYEVPGFSIPTAIIGLMMLFIAIVRRRVRTRFGLLSGLYAAFGGGISAIVFLFDHGYQVLSFFSAIIAVCGTGLMLKGELQLDPRRITLLWLPIPPSISASLFYYMLPSSSTLDSLVLAVFLSFTPTFILYLLSTTVNWVSKTHRELLWSLLAIMTGVIAYLSSYILIIPPFDQVAGIYLGVFAASMIFYPVTARSSRQLFLSPLFFALTGFAYTFVLGPVYQSLLLATAAFLLFVSRYIREREAMNPRLVYLRLIVLVALVASIAAFGITTGLEWISVG